MTSSSACTTSSSTQRGRRARAIPTIQWGRIKRTHEETRRYSSLSRDAQLRVLATFGHLLTLAGREAYDDQDDEGQGPLRLRDINEILHRVLSHIHALASHDRARYPDTVLVAILLEFGDERLRTQALSTLRSALDRNAF